jgi:hypothetical protein
MGTGDSFIADFLVSYTEIKTFKLPHLWLIKVQLKKLASTAVLVTAKPIDILRIIILLWPSI